MLACDVQIMAMWNFQACKWYSVIGYMKGVRLEMVNLYIPPKAWPCLF